MISVETALTRILDLVAPLEAETVPLAEAAGRVLARPVTARRDQPPFPASAMDGYAVRDADIRPGARLRVIGEAPAGHAFGGAVDAGEAVRIFTGAPVPPGADRIVIQEDVTRDGDTIAIGAAPDAGPYVRPTGFDFRAGSRIEPPRRLRPTDIALLAAMNLAEIPVIRRPVVALIATGDELVMPGESPRPDQIIASNTFGLKALVEAESAEARLLPIARDDVRALRQSFALAEGADLVVTVGGASVGDHDLVGDVAAELGMERAFYKVAMRPGKPLMAGRIAGAAMVGLPGNPVSSMVCGHVFIRPALHRLLGFPAAPLHRATAPMAHDLAANGPREHYMRAARENGALRVFDRQDSALLSVLGAADALVVRPVGDPPKQAGDLVEYIAI